MAKLLFLIIWICMGIITMIAYAVIAAAIAICHVADVQENAAY